MIFKKRKVGNEDQKLGEAILHAVESDSSSLKIIEARQIWWKKDEDWEIKFSIVLKDRRLVLTSNQLTCFGRIRHSLFFFNEWIKCSEETSERIFLTLQKANPNSKEHLLNLIN